jgi:predicted small lipoprotein YifL
MKKVLTALTVLLLALCLAACAGRKEDGSSSVTLPAPKLQTAAQTQTPASSQPDDSSQASASSSTASSAPPESGISEEDYAKMTADDLVDLIRDPSQMTIEEYETLFTTYRYVKISDMLDLEQNITDEAFTKLSVDEDAVYPDTQPIAEKYLNSDSPQLRGAALRLMPTGSGVSEHNIELATQLLKTEKDPYVLYCGIVALGNEGNTDPAVGQFLLDMAKNDNAAIRAADAYALGNSWSSGLDGALEAEIELMNDSDSNVCEAACGSIGNLYDEAAIDPLVKILKDPDRTGLHDVCVESLITLWYDYPFFEHTSAKAYKATLDYWKATPRTEDDPAWISINDIAGDTGDAFTAWKAKAAYYKPGEICAVMKNILLDPDADSLARTAALAVTLTHGGPDALKALKADVDALKDEDAAFVQQNYADELASIP